MTSHASGRGTLTGRRYGWWYVVASAGQGDEGNLWQCVCGRHGVERVIPERTLRSQKINSLRLPCRCDEPAGVLTSRVFALWTVLGPTSGPDQPGRRDEGLKWECRCACAAQAVVAHDDLASGRALSCGCRPDEEVAKDLERRRIRAADRLWNLGVDRSRIDRGWTAAMERALRAFQPQCVVCGTAEDLTTHHVQPVSHGHGLRPGNAVRLCRACNSFICDREVGELDRALAGKLQAASSAFQAFWEAGCPAGEVYAAVPPQELPNAPDPALVALLRGVQCGRPDAVPSLAAWLEERGDPRAAAIRELAGLEVVLGKTVTQGDKALHPVYFQRNGTPCRPWSVMVPATSGAADAPLADRVRVLLGGVQGGEVLERLGLSMSQASSLREYLGLRPEAPASTVEEMAQQEGIKPQTVRNRINLALHNLVNPAAAERLEARRRRLQELLAEQPPNVAARVKEG